MQADKSNFSNCYGLTLIEIIVVMTLTLVLVALTTINLSNILPKAEIDASKNVLISDLKAQQLKSMNGHLSSLGLPTKFGVYLESGQYTLFEGDSYIASASSNFVLDIPSSLSLSTTIPNQTLIFSLGSGEIENYNSSSDTITIEDISGVESKTIELNRYGVIDVVN